MNLAPSQFRCTECSFQWEEPPAQTYLGPDRKASPCPSCGSIYAKWTNYEELFGGRGSKDSAGRPVGGTSV